MKYRINFEYESGTAQEEVIVFENESPIIPNIGDIVSYLDGDEVLYKKVYSRHFHYQEANKSSKTITIVIKVQDYQ